MRFQIGEFENAVHDGVFVFFERTAFRSDGDKGFDFFLGIRPVGLFRTDARRMQDRMSDGGKGERNRFENKDRDGNEFRKRVREHIGVPSRNRFRRYLAENQ